MTDAELATSGGFVRHDNRRLLPGGDKVAHTWARVDALGIAHLSSRPSTGWAVAPSPGELRLMESLLGASERRVREVNDPSKLGTALTYLERFGRAFPSRPLWRRRGGGDDKDAAAHNDLTVELLREFIRKTGSVRPGQVGATLPAATISEYTGAITSAMAAELSAPLTGGDAGARLRRQQKSMRIEDGPRATSRVIRRLGFRGSHFKRVLASSFDRLSPRGEFRWMLSLVMYYCMMRAGEPGRGRGTRPFNAQRGARLCDVEWWGAEVTPDGLPAVCFMLVSSKPGNAGQYERRPCEVSARAGGDPALCGYTVFARYWRQRVQAVCDRGGRCSQRAGFCGSCSVAPLFAEPGAGFVPTTAYCMEVARDMCVAIGEPPEEYTGYSWRIGMAGDLVAKLGHADAARVTKRRGRWASDVFAIYQRTDVGEQLRASATVIDAEGQALESLLPQWVQPARRW